MGGWWACSYCHLEKTFDIWMGSSQTMAIKKTKELVIRIGSLLLDFINELCIQGKVQLVNLMMYGGCLCKNYP